MKESYPTMEGTIRYPDSLSFKGYFCNKYIPRGKGTLKLPYFNSTVEQVEMEVDPLTKKVGGKLVYKNGDIFEGIFSTDLKPRKGKYTFYETKKVVDNFECDETFPNEYTGLFINHGCPLTLKYEGTWSSI